jgi:hypothetical protein
MWRMSRSLRILEGLDIGWTAFVPSRYLNEPSCSALCTVLGLSSFAVLLLLRRVHALSSWQLALLSSPAGLLPTPSGLSDDGFKAGMPGHQTETSRTTSCYPSHSSLTMCASWNGSTKSDFRLTYLMLLCRTGCAAYRYTDISCMLPEGSRLRQALSRCSRARRGHDGKHPLSSQHPALQL